MQQLIHIFIVSGVVIVVVAFVWVTVYYKNKSG